MHILILSPNFSTFIFEEALAYHSAGAKVTVLTPHVPDLSTKEIVQENFEIVRFRYFLPTSFQKFRSPNQPLYSKFSLLRIIQLPFFITFFLFSIARFIRKIDIIHANWTPTALLALPYQFVFGVPVVLTYRGSDIRLLPDFFNRFIFRYVRGVLDIWANTNVVWKGTNPKSFSARYLKLPIIARTSKDSFPQARSEKARKKTVQFVFIGRLVTGSVWWKGVDLIIPASKVLSECFSDFKVHIVGDGTERILLERQCSELGVENYVQFHGHQDNVFPFILNSHAVIGGVGLNAVAQESAYCKALLILPDLFERNGEIWTHRKNALLYKPKNPESLAETMLYAIEHPEECKKIALEGYNTIKKYVVSVEEGGKIYLEAFQKIINESKKN